MGRVRWRECHNDGKTVVEEIHKIVVHRFKMGDVEDPDLFAAEPIYNWQQTEQGQFVMANAVEPPVWQRQMDLRHYGYDYAIIAELEAKKLTEFYLKWGKPE